MHIEMPAIGVSGLNGPQLARGMLFDWEDRHPYRVARPASGVMRLADA